jgi:hypothetical protein
MGSGYERIAGAGLCAELRAERQRRGGGKRARTWHDLCYITRYDEDVDGPTRRYGNHGLQLGSCQ